MTKELKLTVNGKEWDFSDKTHAAVFRNFWAFFMDLDLPKTIETIDLVAIRTADTDMFVAKNGSKKKHIRIGDTDRWIYSHLTPAAMEKCYSRFMSGWEGKFKVEKTDAPADEATTEEGSDKEPPTPAAETQETETEPPAAQLTEEEIEQQYLESDEAAEAVEKENNEFAQNVLTFEGESAEVIEQLEAEENKEVKTKEDFAQELYGKAYEELERHQKATVGKKFKNQ